MIDVNQYDALSFDVYGTLLNWEPEVSRFLSDWAASTGLEIEADHLLAAYDRLRQPIQEERPALPYPKVLSQTLQALAKAFGVPVAEDVLARFSRIAATHQAFDDSRPALQDFRARGLRLAALSNIDDDSFAQATAAAGLHFDVVVTAQRVGAYKPDPAHFWAVLADLRALGIPMHRVLHVAQSRRADIVPAKAIGLACVWINRPGHVFGRKGQGAEAACPDFEADSLANLVRMLR